MRILISNDDGYFAPGLACLAEHLAKVADVVVVAPERDRSGASNSLTLDRPLKLRRAANGFYYVNGTPTDCVHLAVTGMLDQQPDMVVSGINAGANMGDDTIYSGTVAAATEGFLLGIPAIALSLVGKELTHYETAARVVAAQLVQRFAKQTHSQPWLLNVNVPDVPYEQLQGIEVTRLGKRHKAEPVVKASNPHGETVYWVGRGGQGAGCGRGHGFSRVGAAARLAHAAADRPDAIQPARCGARLDGSAMNTRLNGIGMTSQRTRTRMIERLREQGIKDEAVLAAMFEVPRHLFVDEALASRAYDDVSLPINFNQTISQPYIVARMIEVLRAAESPERPIERVLEIGTGCGYQAAVLAQVVARGLHDGAHPAAV